MAIAEDFSIERPITGAASKTVTTNLFGNSALQILGVVDVDHARCGERAASNE
jgi:hypothetical protein